MPRHMKTKKEIQHRMSKIFKDSNPSQVTLNEIETARVKELEWVLGIEG